MERGSVGQSERLCNLHGPGSGGSGSHSPDLSSVPRSMRYYPSESQRRTWAFPTGLAPASARAAPLPQCLHLHANTVLCILTIPPRGLSAHSVIAPPLQRAARSIIAPPAPHMCLSDSFAVLPASARAARLPPPSCESCQYCITVLVSHPSSRSRLSVPCTPSSRPRLCLYRPAALPLCRLATLHLLPGCPWPPVLQMRGGGRRPRSASCCACPTFHRTTGSI